MQPYFKTLQAVVQLGTVAAFEYPELIAEKALSLVERNRRCAGVTRYEPWMHGVAKLV